MEEDDGEFVDRCCCCPDETDDRDVDVGRIVTSRPDRPETAATAAAVAAADRVSGEAERDDVDWAAMWASNSCSCWRALTKAAFSRLVCSAFSAFFTFVVTQFSQMTLTSFPEIK